MLPKLMQLNNYNGNDNKFKGSMIIFILINEKNGNVFILILKFKIPCGKF